MSAVAEQQQLDVDPAEAERKEQAKRHNAKVTKLEKQVSHLISVLPGVLREIEKLRR